MKKVTFVVIFLTILSIILIGCSEDSTITVDNVKTNGAKFEITNTQIGMKSYGNPYVTITVKNVSNSSGYNVSCQVYAKKNNTIVDTGFAYFANGGTIAPGESAIDEAIFFKVKTFTGYELQKKFIDVYDLKYELSWLDVS